MQAYDDGADKPHDSESIEPRDARALTECMTVLPKGGDIFDVATESGSSYRVDSREGRCTCPDHQYREVTCKHIRRVAFATGQRHVPEWVDTDAVDPHLGDHVDGSPRQVASDGGVTVPDSEDDTDDTDGRPEECDCGEWNQGLGLSCWRCYRDGYETPAGTE